MPCLALVGAAIAAALPQEQPPLRIADASALRAALAAAGPGTVLELAPGDYGSVHATGVRGTAERPIVIRAAAGGSPTFRAGMHLRAVEHVVLAGLLFADCPTNGLNIDDAGSSATPSRHVVLRGLRVRDVGGAGNHDGIKLSGVVDFEIVDCTIERWGRSGSAIDMVGCQRGRIEDCTIRDLADRPAANGIQMKGGTRDVVVRRCRFVDAGQRAVQLGGSTGRAYFRPAPAGFEARDLVVEGCTFEGAAAAIAFVGCDGALVRHNTIVRPGRWVLRILQETRDPDFVPCRRGVFVDNLIVWHGFDTVVNIGPGTAPETFEFARNWWFRSDAPARSSPHLPTRERDPADGIDPRLDDGLRPQHEPARAYGAHALPPRHSIPGRPR
jgi:hypothetical protein